MERDAVGIRKLVLVYPPRTPTLEMPRDSKLKEANMATVYEVCSVEKIGFEDGRVGG